MFKYLKSATYAFGTMAVAVALALGLSSTGAQDTQKPEAKAPVAAQVVHKKLAADEIPAYLQDISVTIHAGRAQGSGVIVTRDGVNYVLTAGHVVEHLRSQRPVIDPKTGSPKVITEFEDAKVVKEVYDDDGRSVGRIMMDAEVLRYSDADNGEDLALLRLRKKDFVKCSARFDKAGLEKVGTDLIHVGSLLGQMGSNSLTTGVVSQNGRVYRGTIYDQSTCAAFPGSSGGGIYRKADGVYVGMIVRGAGETFNLYVPMRRMQKWTERVGVQFVLDHSLPVPEDKVLRKTPIEDSVGMPGGADSKAGGNSPHHGVNGERNIPFLINLTPQIQPLPAQQQRKIHIEW